MPKDFEIHVDPTTGREYTTVAGVRVELADQEECERATFVICGPESYFADDVHTLCAFCGTPIVHRPYAPKRPPKLCIGCVMRMESQPKN